MKSYLLDTNIISFALKQNLIIREKLLFFILFISNLNTQINLKKFQRQFAIDATHTQHNHF